MIITDITSFCSCKDLEWRGCYGSGAKYNKYIIPESVKHPAKMSWELLERIFKHLESMNLLTPDSVVIDFMAGCYDTETEVLTSHGWKYFKDIEYSDEICTLDPKTDLIEYQKPVRIIEKPYKGKMYYLSTKQINLLVTPDHSLYVAKRNSLAPRKDWKYSFLTPETIFNKPCLYKKNGVWIGKKTDAFVLPYVEYNNQNIPTTKNWNIDDWLKFFGIWVAEGSVTNHRDVPNEISIRHFGTYLLVIKDILERIGYKPSYNEKEGQLKIYDKQLSVYLSQFAGASNKHVPPELKELSPDKLMIFLESYIEGDGHKGNYDNRKTDRYCCWTSSIQLRDDLQEIALKVGWSANYYLATKKGDISVIEGRKIVANYDNWAVSFNRKQNTPIATTVYNKWVSAKRNKPLSLNEDWVEYEGIVYCVEVPNHIIYIRRNGKPVWCGNSGRTGTMAALRRYRTISVELEPHFIEMIAGYDCDGKSISDFKIEPCVCKSDTLHKPHKITTGLFEVECSGNPRIVPVCRCGGKIHHRKHHIPGNRELLAQVTGRKVKWDVICGDARELRRLMNLTDMVGVVSPPYFSQVAYQDKEFIKSIAEDKSQRYRDGRLKGHFATPEAIRRYAEKIMETYSLDPQNIGNLKDVPLVGITSPPYAQDQHSRMTEKCAEVFEGRSYKVGKEYSLNPDNIGNFKDVPLAGIISPPYQDTAMPSGCPAHIRKLAREGDWDKAIELERKSEADQAKKGNKFAVSTDETIRKKIEMALEREMGNYSENPDNIGNLKDIPLIGIMSPPYSEAQQGGGIVINGYSGPHIHEMGKNQPDKVGQKCGYLKELHGSDPGNIGNLPDRPIVGITSPPYLIDPKNVCHTKEGKTLAEYDIKRGYQPTAHQTTDYSTNPLNIGNQPDESYLSAMFKVYQQAYLCGISPLVVVTKNPTRNGTLRRLDLDTISLLQACGYKIFDYHRSILFETHTQNTLDGDSKDVHKGRISFFKRLSLEKGTTVAQFEDIIFAWIPINCARPISKLRAPDSGGNV